MNRVFSKSQINDLCDDLKDIMKECEKHLEDMKGTANEAKDAEALVPVEALTGTVSSAVDSFISAVDAIDFQNSTTKLSN